MQKTVYLVLICMFLSCLPVQADETGSAYYDFGVFAYEDGDYENAENNLKTALTFEPDNPYYNHYMGKTFLKTERYEDAGKHFDKAWNADPDIPELKYDIAMLRYKQAQYPESARLFKEVAKENPSNILAGYYAGISLYKAENYQDATDYFINVGEASPSVRTNSYYYAGMCYQKTGQSDKAVELFEYVKEHDTGTLGEYAEKWIQAIQEDDAMKPYQLYLKTGFRYDDNIQLEPDDTDIYTDEDDYGWMGYFSGRYHFLNSERFRLGAGYSHYQTWYDTLHEYEVTGSLFNLYAEYRMADLTLGLNYSPTYYWLDSESYLRQHRLTPDLTWKISENLISRISYTYADDEYFQNLAATGHSNEFSLDVYYGIPNTRWVVFATMAYEDNSAAETYETYEQIKTRLGASVKLPWELTLTLTGKYYGKTFDADREDDKYYGSISLSHKLFYEWLDIVADIEHIKNNSNFSIKEYERNIATLSVAITY